MDITVQLYARIKPRCVPAMAAEQGRPPQRRRALPSSAGWPTLRGRHLARTQGCSLLGAVACSAPACRPHKACPSFQVYCGHREIGRPDGPTQRIAWNDNDGPGAGGGWSAKTGKVFMLFHCFELRGLRVQEARAGEGFGRRTGTSTRNVRERGRHEGRSVCCFESRSEAHHTAVAARVYTSGRISHCVPRNQRGRCCLKQTLGLVVEIRRRTRTA